MKIRVEIDPANGEEEEVVIRCSTLSEEVMMLQKQLSEIVSSKLKLEVYKGDTVLYLSPDEILFLETADNFLAVHTAKEIYSAKQRLYELEEMLPSSFVRISKSSIVNITNIRSVKRNIAGPSEIEFSGTIKRAYASRNYLKQLMNRLEEKRLNK
ncbi:MAG: LytTR family transcriptional regulator [Lachnospiraceae bacterium]|nr:LytTR family transcriptional regulator [Lachnospiraceae bacterium]